MKARDLRIDDLLEVPPSGGVIRFGGRRTLLLDAVALGLLRAQLVETFGATVTRGLLTRLGYGHGRSVAEALETTIPWDDPSEWRVAGGRLHRLQGLVSFEPVTPAQRLDPDAFAEAIWRDSYEAEQHVLHLGRSDDVVCWTLAGFASGYLGYVTGREVYCVEARCVGRGDAVCHMVGRFAEDWGPRRAEIALAYEKDCLDGSLDALTGTLRSLETRVRRRRRQLAEPREVIERHGFIARSDAMRRLLALVDRAAKVDTTVIVCGESGVGKERVARMLHDESARCGGPYVAVNCGALPESLLESELFGHAKGAFTGAATERAGLFEAANGGTLFLDEVGELPLSLQPRLLRALQEREVRRLGENHPRRIDVRVVAATNRRLPDMVREGTFRQDLYYRLAVLEVEIPPLRARPDDILPLARAKLAEASDRVGRDVRSIAPDAARRLLAHAWPGNVRELANAMERAVIFADGDRIEAADLPAPVDAPASSPVPGGAPSLAEVERAHIAQALDAVGGNRERAAARLGISPATLYRRLRRYRDA